MGLVRFTFTRTGFNKGGWQAQRIGGCPDLADNYGTVSEDRLRATHSVSRTPAQSKERTRKFFLIVQHYDNDICQSNLSIHNFRAGSIGPDEGWRDE